MERKYQICTKCVMDTTDIEIVFDANGVCNHCYEYEIKKKRLILDPIKRDIALKNLINEIKESGKDKKYDCIVGISGGVDSSYVAYLAKQWDLRVLLVHLDNGWDSELAVKNIENIVKFTGFDLYSLVIDWEEFKDLQRSFFKADVIDLELLSDHAISASVNKLARKYNVKYLLSGDNFETESIMPSSWKWRKADAKNIKAIHSLFGNKKLKTYPFMSSLKRLVYKYFNFAQSVNILNYLEFYNKENVIKLLQENFSWKYYGGKHYESIFTRFYQGYILPKKFNIDKRRAHYSSLINSKQMKREDALLDLEKQPYPVSLQNEDFELVCKKLGFSNSEMQEYINRKEINHEFYGSDKKLINTMHKIYKLLKKTENDLGINK